MFEKKIFCFVLVFVFISLFLLPLPVSAGIWEKLANLPLTIPSAAVAGIIWIIAEAAALFAALSNVILNWVLSPGFTELPYTKPGPLPNGNPIIEAGLSITQGFVNMLLVLVLVYIAVATILRLAGYETKKLLVTFIIVALLVNFAPVICGLIVDASNIVMSFFIEGIGKAGGTTLVNKLADIAKIFTSGFLDAIFDFRLMAGKIMQLAVIAVANIALGFILQIFAWLFIARYIAIWILVILSPIAFACYILPATRKYWTMWWEQFIQWSIVGITCSFFLYLGMMLANLPPNTFSTPTGFATAVLPHLVSVAFLFIGLIYGLQTSAKGAAGIINAVKGGEKWVTGKTWKGLNLADRWKIAPKVKGKEERAESGKKWYNPARYLGLTTPRGAAKQITKSWEGVPGLRWFRPEPLRKFGEFRSAIEDRKKEITGPSEIEIERVDRGVYSKDKAAAAVDSIVRERGDSNDIIKYYMKKYDEPEEELLKDDRFLKDKNLLNAIEFIAEAGNRGKIDRIDPRLAKIGRTKEQGREKMIEAIVNAKPSDVAMMEREVPENEEVMEIVLAFGDDDFFRSLGRLKGKVQARQRTIDNMFSKWVDKNERDTTKNKENWEAFIKNLGERHNVLTPGIAKALSNVRFQSAGWGYIKEFNSGARYQTKEQIKESQEYLATPFGEAGMGQKPPSAEPPSSPEGKPVEGMSGFLKSKGGIIYPEEIKKREPKGRSQKSDRPPQGRSI